MYTFTAVLQRFEQKGEKTGWTYIDIPIDITQALKPGQKTSFRVKGTLDTYPIALVALIPMGTSGDATGSFIMAVKATMRRGIRKEEGATVRVTLEADDSPMPLSADLMTCLADDPTALDFFNTLAKGHQVYFSNWIESARTMETKTKRITQAVRGLSMGMGYGEMTRYFKKLS
ncbi:YdeI/OmpD-associated family protein [Spirosoma utsteinense]|uniref:DUF1905 domain-containing protein n=1 Tax=Spirosoma utsteinense TaxID=2585773 RepID=A0ABR6W2Q0_9BACT|nr:YdeI/OmpD-associated family protein [Spirosoma utsteinense]MBC3788162.1 hypothetical protein [Spirosoma utsteinense]MBC3790489.1 hypothetical protein [Spirosoma utsteinense]